ncbi:MAG TPA: DUF4145 domain-containing protein [Verrucomicrobiae bacterium]|nr:DUF4145 domain-containing protein [Verrucomicrobiae bacterium]
MANPTLFAAGHLEMDRCPHCRVANPFLPAVHGFNSEAGSLRRAYQWRVYVCSKCGLPILGGCYRNEFEIRSELIFPKSDQIEEGMPNKARSFLIQAIESVHAPSGAIMLCASAVDAMLKEKGFKAGSLYARIEEAVSKHLITKEMSLWAHDVRLDANDERHADEAAALPSEIDAKRCIDFVKALADFLFILPARIERGRSSKQEPEKKS